MLAAESRLDSRDKHILIDISQLSSASLGSP